MWLEPWVPPCVHLGLLFSCGSSGGSDWLILLFFPWGCKPHSAPSVLSLTPSLGTQCSVNYKHLPLYLSGSGRASQETAISGSCQQTLLGIHNSVWVYGIDPQVRQSLDDLSISLCSTLCLHISSCNYCAPTFSEGPKHPHFGFSSSWASCGL